MAISKTNVRIGTKRILIVDDNSIDRLIANNILNQVGGHLTLTHARNGKEAMSLILKGSRYDLILLDINMPIMSGKEVLEELSKNNVDVPVVVLSTSLHPDDIKFCRRMKVLKYFQKPLTEELARKVLKLI